MRFRPTPSLLLSLLLAGCLPDAGPVSPAEEAAAFSLLGGLEVGGSLVLSGEEARSVFLNGGDGSEYLYVPFHAADSGSLSLRVDVEGGNLREGGAAASAVLPAGARLTRSAGPPPGDRAHLRLRDWERKRLAGLARGGAPRSARARMSRRAADVAAAVPQVGDTHRVRVPNLASLDLCESPLERDALVVAVTARAILMEDVRNPARLTGADVARIADEYDRHIYPVNAENFGEPTDVDANERVVVLVTSALNEMARLGRGITVGFAFLPDLLPRSIPEWRYECAASNQGEIFYLIAPDPFGEVTGGLSIPTSYVSGAASSIIAHELQHVTNFGRRLYEVPGVEDVAEEVWLNEGLSHMAEELLFYAVTGLRPGANLDRQTLQASPEVAAAFERFQGANIGLFEEYLRNPDGETLMGRDELDDDFATRGAAWAFLRYLADHDGRPDAELFRALVNSPVGGMRNLERALEGDPRDWMQRWTVANYTDDLVPGVDARFTQPSWNFRSLFDAYPLRVHTLGPSDEMELKLQGGGASYVHLRALRERQARVTAERGGAGGPGELRVSVVRIR